MGKKIFICDDDDVLVRLLSLLLETRGYTVSCAANGIDCMRQVYTFHPDLIILDVGLPYQDGYHVCEHLREFTNTPILFLSGRSLDEDVIRGFRAGADDYVKKPFNNRELIMRIQAILNRAGQAAHLTSPFYNDGTLMVDIERRQVQLEGQPVHLTPTEFRLLECLLTHQGKVIPHDKLLKSVWGEAYQDAVPNLSLYIRYLRQKIEVQPDAPEYICTEWGVGYWFRMAPAYEPSLAN